MRLKKRFGIVLLCVAVSLLLPVKATAQKGGGGFWDWIKELGPPINGIGVTAFEICIGGLIVGDKYGDCPVPIEERGEAVRRFFWEVKGEWEVESHRVVNEILDPIIRDDTADPSMRASARNLKDRIRKVDEWLGSTTSRSPAIQIDPTQNEIKVGETTLAAGVEGGRKPPYLRRDVEIIAWQTQRIVAVVEQLESALLGARRGVPSADTIDALEQFALLADLPKSLSELRDERLVAEVKEKRVVFTFLRFNTGYGRGSAADIGGAERINKIILSPMLSFEVETVRNLSAYFEGGITYHYFYGDGLDNFWRYSVDTGVGLRYTLWKTPFFIDGGLKFRYFPTPFTRQDFGAPGQPVTQGGSGGGEWVWGPMVGLGFHFDRLFR